MAVGRKILHSESSMGWGGQEIRVLAELLAMQERGHQVSLCAPSTSQIAVRGRDAGLDVWELDDRKWMWPISIWKIAQRLRQRGIEVVNTHSSKDGWVVGIAARWAGVPCVIRSRHIDVEYPRVAISRIAYGRLPHIVLTTSEKIRQRLMDRLSLDPSKIFCVATGIDLAKFSTLPDRAEVCAAWGIAGDMSCVGMVSVLRSWKGHRIFLEACKLLISQHPGLSILIVGEGPQRQNIQSWIEEFGLHEHVRMLGHLEDIRPALAVLDVLVLPSLKHEGIPQIILQAQGAGTPVVASDAGGIPEVVRDGVTGLLVPTGDAQALAQSVNRLLSDPASAKALAREAKERALAEYGISAMCQKLESIYGSRLSTK